MNTSFPMPPKVDKRPHVQSWHGQEKRDDYFWLKAGNWQEVMQDPAALPSDIRDYLEAENGYQDAVMADTIALQETLFGELKGRIKEDDTSVPVPHGPFLYLSSYVKGGQYPRFQRRRRDGGGEQMMVDCNALAVGKDYFSLGDISVSLDHALAAWSFDDKGSEFYTLKIRDLNTLEDSEDLLTNTGGSASWSLDGKSIFYTLQDDNHRPLQTFRHVLGTPQSADTLVFDEKDTGMFTGVGQTLSGDYIILSVHDHDTSECWLIDAATPDAEPRCVAPRKAGLEYELEHWGEQFLIKTNADNAEDYKIVAAPIADPSPANWVDVVPHRSGVFIINYIVLKDWLIWMERENALPRIMIRNFETGEDHAIAFDEEAYSLGFGDMREFDTDVLRFSYSSPTTPNQIYDYDMRSRTRELRKTQEVPSGHDPAHYETRRVLAPAHDGELIPITLLYRKGLKRDGVAPLWLYGYGAYGISMPAGFNTNILSLADRGFVYATAHIRGGQEKGRRWYTNGKLEHKVNTFKDFISCAEHLIAQNYTTRGNIVAHGGSAGGLLMGAVANMRPDLFKAIVADVPFVDALTTILDDTLPLTPPEWPEWGNPITDKMAYDTIAAYSPYENVARQAYPHILAEGGLTDPRVTYWEPAKWVAKLRTHNTSESTILLKINMGAGHGGASGRFDRLKEVALNYAFGLKMCGMIDAA
jgi:oligopeptidase B